MIVEMAELGETFEFHLEPEDMEEQVKLVRFGLNKTTKIEIGVNAFRDKQIRGWISVEKNKRGTASVG